MFCFTAIRACRPCSLWPSVVTAAIRRQGLNTRNSPATAAAQSQSGIKKRVQRRKPALVEDTGQRHGYWCVSAFSTAEEFRLEQLSAALSKTNMYEPTCLYSGSDDSEETAPADVIHAVSKFHVTNEPRHLYFFREGSVVGWNVSDLEVSSLINFVAEHEIGSYDDHIVMDERESMYYAYTNDKKSSIQKGNVYLIGNDVTASDLDRYTFSNAMAHSVKLGTWEALLEEYIDSVEVVTQDLQNGLPIRITRKEVMKKTGELFGLRHRINLSSDLLDLPDFYWEREHLETFYRSTCNYFSISTRLKTMNVKINHCLELVELLSHHLSDKHHIRLEWMIIVLIMVEVGFEIIHYAQLFIK
ncbi:required for meiotic nuclear division protein 1 homolog [Rhopalosiphum padi]|uniref:required for meiotic nuclear division protein 1 homolog n=1 Tax=Rhopalosiphum padi TaxID=40932 RepID=UPI00298D64F7|nr:required for meiotic nuclear division protein 1 homolog [Rhopalosiphum padi]